MQASAAVDQARQKILASDQLRGADVTNAVVTVTSCPKCNASLAPGAKFCAQCGSGVAAAGPKFCSGCGGALTAGARFCAGCGAGVT